MVAARRDDDVPALAEPAHVRPRRVRRAARRDPRRRPPPSACASRASTRGASTSSRRASMFLATAMELFDFDELTISEWALREGIVLDASAATTPPTGPTTRARSAARRWSALARRCNWPEAHARQVARLALVAVRPDQRAARARRRRPRAARVRRAAPRHRRARVVARATTATARTSCDTASSAASTPTRSRLLTALVRWHRRGDPERRRALRSPTSTRVQKLAALLRIADGLDRSRTGVGQRRRRAGQPVARARCACTPTATPSSSSGARAASASCSRRSSTASSSSPPTRRLTPQSRSARCGRYRLVDDPGGGLHDVGAARAVGLEVGVERGHALDHRRRARRRRDRRELTADPSRPLGPRRPSRRALRAAAGAPRCARRGTGGRLPAPRGCGCAGPRGARPSTP